MSYNFASRLSIVCSTNWLSMISYQDRITTGSKVGIFKTLCLGYKVIYLREKVMRPFKNDKSLEHCSDSFPIYLTKRAGWGNILSNTVRCALIQGESNQLIFCIF